MPQQQIDLSIQYMQYIVNVEIEPEYGKVGTASVATNDRPFMLTSIRHEIIYDGVSVASTIQQDGLYSIDWSLFDTDRFFKGSKPMANAAFGSPRFGNWKDFAVPIPMEKSVTLHAAVMNLYVGDRTDDWKVQVIFNGVERLK